MAVKQPGQLIYWIHEDFWHVIGEVIEKREGWYRVGRSVSMVGSAAHTNEKVLFGFEGDERVYKRSVREIPEWLPEEIFRRIFRPRDTRLD